MSLKGKTVLITGAAIRVGKAMALSAADAGANMILHYGSSEAEAAKTLAEVQAKGVQAEKIHANLNDTEETQKLIENAHDQFGQIDVLINNAAIFGSIGFLDTAIEDWQKHFQINLTAPFLLSQGFAKKLPEGSKGRILNILDWRALRPGADHFPYTISKSGLAALTKSLAISLAPNISVNGIALGAILPPSDGGLSEKILKDVPLNRWATLEEVGETMRFLLEGPEYITGEIVHLDGGRHLI